MPTHPSLRHQPPLRSATAATHALLCLAAASYASMHRELGRCGGRSFCWDDMAGRMLTVHAGFALYEILFWWVLLTVLSRATCAAHTLPGGGCGAVTVRRWLVHVDLQCMRLYFCGPGVRGGA